ncbi:MAG: radical SAM protein, partial [Bacillota bacterium]|nr:radical SAM protein [Bacillota bacterium]
LKHKGAVFRNDGKSIYVNHISPSCIACQKGIGSMTFFISLQCSRNCFYCFNPNQEDFSYYCNHKRNCIDELDDLYRKGYVLKHIALTGGEPLLHKKDTVEFIKFAHTRYPKAHLRLYTCGDFIDVKLLEQLKIAGLDEIRFSIKMEDRQEQQQKILDRIKLAVDYIPSVMVEMPVLPGTLDEMKDLLVKLDQINISGINLLEFCFPYTNAQKFKDRSYKLKHHPFRVLYDYWYAGGLPISKSEIECLSLLEFTIDEKLQIGVHYCSLENKHTGQIYQQNLLKPKHDIAYFSPRDYFLKSIKVFGDDIPHVLNVFKKIDFHQYVINNDHAYLEFPVQQVKYLRELKLELGISTAIIEKREDGEFLRELKVDLSYPNVFDCDDL